MHFSPTVRFSSWPLLRYYATLISTILRLRQTMTRLFVRKKQYNLSHTYSLLSQFWQLFLTIYNRVFYRTVQGKIFFYTRYTEFRFMRLNALRFRNFNAPPLSRVSTNCSRAIIRERYKYYLYCITLTAIVRERKNRFLGNETYGDLSVSLEPHACIHDQSKIHRAAIWIIYSDDKPY